MPLSRWEGLLLSHIQANMAGSVWKILVKVGEDVAEGQDVVILESMKMEIPISAEESGLIKRINVNEGDFVNEGDVLVEYE
ncbi:acetyl-CoA carboxylase biotin carboxyl carrier protein subunit [Metabacillus endolithicus]|uniref:Acetyl-CoA carboxylase biotin carboxyl carrier protein subunit n=1 Tax=Metabacillus endolithicus TaxID=1535204 RepID=A0ABW5C012_9BACI